MQMQAPRAAGAPSSAMAGDGRAACARSAGPRATQILRAHAHAPSWTIRRARPGASRRGPGTRPPHRRRQPSARTRRESSRARPVARARERPGRRTCPPWQPIAQPGQHDDALEPAQKRPGISTTGVPVCAGGRAGSTATLAAATSAKSATSARGRRRARGRTRTSADTTARTGGRRSARRGEVGVGAHGGAVRWAMARMTARRRYAHGGA